MWRLLGSTDDACGCGMLFLAILHVIFIVATSLLSSRGWSTVDCSPRYPHFLSPHSGKTSHKSLNLQPIILQAVFPPSATIAALLSQRRVDRGTLISLSLTTTTVLCCCSSFPLSNVLPTLANTSYWTPQQSSPQVTRIDSMQLVGSFVAAFFARAFFEPILAIGSKYCGIGGGRLG